MRVLFLIHDLGHGGAEKVLVNLVNHLDRSRFDITVLALFGGGVNEQFLKPDIHYRTVFSKAFPGNSHVMKLFSPRLLHKLFVKEHYDIEVLSVFECKADCLSRLVSIPLYCSQHLCLAGETE